MWREKKHIQPWCMPLLYFGFLSLLRSFLHHYRTEPNQSHHSCTQVMRWREKRGIFHSRSVIIYIRSLKLSHSLNNSLVPVPVLIHSSPSLSLSPYPHPPIYHSIHASQTTTPPPWKKDAMQSCFNHKLSLPCPPVYLNCTESKSESKAFPSQQREWDPVPTQARGFRKKGNRKRAGKTRKSLSSPPALPTFRACDVTWWKFQLRLISNL